MNPAYETTPETQESSDRRAEVELLEDLREAQRSGTSLPQFARQQGVQVAPGRPPGGIDS